MYDPIDINKESSIEVEETPTTTKITTLKYNNSNINTQNRIDCN